MNRYLFLVITILLLSVLDSYAQLSEGGKPRNAIMLKSALASVMVMPEVNNEQLRWEAQKEQESNLLKPFRFAHGFDVDFSPANSGSWYQSEDGWWIWKLHIVSKDAYSLNLIFREVKSGLHGRLFIYTPDQGSILGAFTAATIPPENILAISPLPGDEIIVQYETPAYHADIKPFVISQVNHDFIGILKVFDERRPLDKTAGPCIPDVACEIGDPWREVQNSTMRIMIEGKEYCTGTLVNNTRQNARPFILTANHCISTRDKALSSLFLFNYESPYCGSLDGDVSNSLSGSRLRATHDSLDFSLVELTVAPPPSFRPYFAGWSRSRVARDSVAIIHHSQADIKKISVDLNAPQMSNFGSSQGYTPMGFWKISRWEYGATEVGASGGGLFNTSGQVIGSLVGGSSRCGFPNDDYFARIDMAWDNRPDSASQLKYWLDPAKTGTTSIDGQLFYEGEKLCKSYTHLSDGDDHEILKLTTGTGTFAGYWTGTNNQDIIEIGEKFSIPGNEVLQGVSLGVGLRKMISQQSESRIRVNVYNMRGSLMEIIHTQVVPVKELVPGAMNLVAFNELVQPADSFLVALNLEGMLQGDSIALYQAVRDDGKNSTMFVRKGNLWSEFRTSNTAGYGGSLVVELVACNVSSLINDSTIVKNPVEIKAYPNPTTGLFEISSSRNLSDNLITVYDILGRSLPFHTNRLTPRKLVVNIKGHPPGIYMVRVQDQGYVWSAKIKLEDE
ncbi:por secretion system C-terminal sorting domain [Bacteroidales bacterium 6E]|nr:por secretion system C-terminal sorting domain [Bacteroidales bacterium 6E]